jgi:hypothetical protein
MEYDLIMKTFLGLGFLGCFAILMYTAFLLTEGESPARILNETFLLWIITIIFFVIYFYKSKKSK